MTVDPNHRTPSSEEKKLPTHIDLPADNDQYLRKTRRYFQSTSFLYPILLTLLLIVGTVLLVLTVTRRNACRQAREERIEVFPHDHTTTWVPCVKSSHSSACVCPASFIHSSVHSSHCIPNHSRCLRSCRKNAHCACYHVRDATRCRAVTRNWIDNELHLGPLQAIHSLTDRSPLQAPWSDHLHHHVEHLLVDSTVGERLFFSSDRRTAVTIDKHQDDYLLNERWTKLEANTTHQHLIYHQLNPQTNTCRMSLVHDNGTATHGEDHTCPGRGAPYFLGIACTDILVLWHGGNQLKTRRDEGWAISRHNFESSVPRLPVLLDPFHRYYTLYDDSMMEIKDLNGDVLVQLFTEITDAHKFEFIDQYGTILVANRTHMQLLSSKNKEAWLDV